MKTRGTDDVGAGAAADFGKLSCVAATAARHGVDKSLAAGQSKLGDVDAGLFYGVEKKVWVAMGGEAWTDDDVFMGVANACLGCADVSGNGAKEGHGLSLYCENRSVAAKLIL